MKALLVLVVLVLSLAGLGYGASAAVDHYRQALAAHQRLALQEAVVASARDVRTKKNRAKRQP